MKNLGREMGRRSLILTSKTEANVRNDIEEPTWSSQEITKK